MAALSKNTQILFDKLVADYSSRMPLDERNIFDPNKCSAYIYNLFKGDYAFSYKQFEELYNYLSAETVKQKIK